MKFLLLFLFVATVANADVKKVACNTLSEHPGDQTPTPSFQLVQKDGKYEALFTKDSKKAAPAPLLNNLTCQFRRVVGCENLRFFFSECASIDPSHADWKKPKAQSIVFTCEEEGSFPRKSVQSKLNLNLEMIQKDKVVNNGATMKLLGFNTNTVDGVDSGIFSFTFPIASRCVASDE